MFTEISLDNFIPDVLHQFLRIFDKLVTLLILEIFRADKFKPNSTFDPTKHKQLDALGQFCIQYLKMDLINNGETESTIKNSTFKNLMGPKKRLFLEKITSPTRNLETIFGKAIFNMTNNRTTSTVHQLWLDYYKIDKTLHSEKKVSSKSFNDSVTKWLKDFKQIFGEQEITPYIHMFGVHLPFFYDRFVNLNYFSAQGLEKLNDMSTFQYFKSTNKKKNYLEQILNKDCRIFSHKLKLTFD